MPFNVIEQKPTHTHDGYCNWCETDFDPNAEYPEYVIKAFKNQFGEWVWYVMHEKCYRQLHQFDTL